MPQSQHMAAFPPLIPREVLFGNPDKFSPRISPDGRLLAYCAPHKGVLNVWVRTLDGHDDRVITGEESRGVHLLLWQPDETFGGVVAFTPNNKSVVLISNVDANAARFAQH
jgi:hypothetical protein